MPLKIDQRVERLQARLRELAFWRARATREIDGWRCDGQPIVVGAPWPRRDGVLRFEALASVPDAWPLDETRLWLDLGGESLLTLRYDGGESAAFGLDVNHQEFPLAGRRVAIASESVARRPFGQPVADPRLQRALFVWLDLALARFADRLALVVEAAETLGAHDAVEPLVDAAEAALRAIDWPSTTADYIARVAPSPSQQALWRPGRGGDDRPRPSRPRLAVALRGDPAQAQAHLLDRARADAGGAGIPLQPVERAFLRADRTGRPGAVLGDQGPSRRRPMGADRRHVGRAGRQHALRREPGAADSLRPALFRARLRSEASRLLAARLLRFLGGAAAAAAPGRDRFVSHHQGDVERNQRVSPRSLLVGGARRQPRARPHLRQSREWLQWRSAAGLRRADLGKLSRQGALPRDAAGGRLWRRRRRPDAAMARQRAADARIAGAAQRALDAGRRFLRPRP